jgi:dipeptide/tripeptide permease
MIDNTSTTRRKDSDRRITLRFSDPHIRKVSMTIHRIISYLGIFILILSVATILTGLFRRPYESAVQFALGTLGILFATLLFRYGRGLSYFVKNESAPNLAEAMERQKHIWLILSITVTLVTLLSLVIHL